MSGLRLGLLGQRLPTLGLEAAEQMEAVLGG